MNWLLPLLQRGFEPQWLSVTFSKAIFLGNGLIAIVSGLFASLLVDNLEFDPVAPFDAAACFLALGMAIILLSWSENYGDPSESKDLITQFNGAAAVIASGKCDLTSVDNTRIPLLILRTIGWSNFCVDNR